MNSPFVDLSALETVAGNYPAIENPDIQVRQPFMMEVENEEEWDEAYVDEDAILNLSGEDELTDRAEAVRKNENYGLSLGWIRYVIEINELLLRATGQQGISLGQEDFAEAVAVWQQQNGFTGKDVDGILGPNTWRKMSSQLSLGGNKASQTGTTVRGNSAGKTADRILQYAPLIVKYSQLNNLSPSIVCGIIAAESDGKQDSGAGNKGYKGLMQAGTSADQLDPETSIETGIKKFIAFRDKTLTPWLTRLHITLPNTANENFLRVCLSCYNAGPVTALKAVQYANAAGNWEAWLAPEHYKRALLFSGGYARYDACNKRSAADEIEAAKKERLKYRFKTSNWRTEPDPPDWNTAISSLHPLTKCWIETKFKNTPGYLDKFIQYIRYFNTNPISTSQQPELYEEAGDIFAETAVPDSFSAGYEMTSDQSPDLMAATYEENETDFDSEEWAEDWEDRNEQGEQDFETGNPPETESLLPFGTWPSIATTLVKGVKQVADWLAKNTGAKTYFPDEPRENIDQLPLPPWMTAESFYTSFLEKYGDNARTIIGDKNKPVTARYFVLHDTAVAADFSAERVKGKGIHLWLNARKPVVLSLDWHEKGLGVKLERRRNNAFLHVEITRDKDLQASVLEKTKKKKISAEEFIQAGGVRSYGTYYNDLQYELLAVAYIVASLRKGSFLTVTIHREVDRSVVKKRANGAMGYGHDDPQFFDLDYFYQCVCRLLGFSQRFSFGIQPARALWNKQGNSPGYINEFIPFVTGDAPAANQYGEPKKMNPQSSRYKLVKLKYGYYYDVSELKNSFDSAKPSHELMENQLPTGGTISAPPLYYEDNSVAGHTCYVRIDLGMGNYPLNMTGIYMPGTFDPALPADIILYFHGMTGTFPGPCAKIDDYWTVTTLPKYDLTLRQEVAAAGKNIILVAPSLGDSPNHYKNTLSGQPGGLDRYMDQVGMAINNYLLGKYYSGKTLRIRNIILAAHSAGGYQMMLTATTPNPAYGSMISECWGFDSLYEGKKGVVNSWLKWVAADKTRKLFIYFKSSTEGNARLLAKKAGAIQNIFVKASTAPGHYHVPKAHLKERIQKIGNTTLTKQNFEAPDLEETMEAEKADYRYEDPDLHLQLLHNQAEDQEENESMESPEFFFYGSPCSHGRCRGACTCQ